MVVPTHGQTPVILLKTNFWTMQSLPKVESFRSRNETIVMTNSLPRREASLSKRKTFSQKEQHFTDDKSSTKANPQKKKKNAKSCRSATSFFFFLLFIINLAFIISTYLFIFFALVNNTFFLQQRVSTLSVMQSP